MISYTILGIVQRGSTVYEVHLGSGHTLDIIDELLRRIEGALGHFGI